METLALITVAAGTALATGIGALPVSALGPRAHRLRAWLAGTAVGAMAVASLVGLLVPAARTGSTAAVVGGAALGAAFVIAARARLSLEGKTDMRLGPGAQRSLLVFGVLLVHSLPEGFAIGGAWASAEAGLGVFVVLAIALQNIPEGTAIAIPMAAAGFSRGRQVTAAILSSAPQPVGALAAYLLVEQVHSVLAVSLAFAAGAMAVVVGLELVPEAWRGDRLPAVYGAAAGGAAMLALSAALGV